MTTVSVLHSKYGKLIFLSHTYLSDVKETFHRSYTVFTKLVIQSLYAE